MLKWSINFKRHLLSDEIVMNPQYHDSGFHGDDGNIEEVRPYRYKTSDRWKIKKSPSRIPRCWQVLIAVGCTVLALASIQLTLLWTDALTLDHILAIRNVMGRHGRVHEKEYDLHFFSKADMKSKRQS